MQLHGTIPHTFKFGCCCSNSLDGFKVVSWGRRSGHASSVATGYHCWHHWQDGCQLSAAAAGVQAALRRSRARAASSSPSSAWRPHCGSLSDACVVTAPRARALLALPVHLAKGLSRIGMLCRRHTSHPLTSDRKPKTTLGRTTCDFVQIDMKFFLKTVCGETKFWE